MKANVLAPFKGVVDGEHQTKSFKRGDTIHGDLASAMVDAGFAEEITIKKPAAKAKADPKNKAKQPAKNKQR